MSLSVSNTSFDKLMMSGFIYDKAIHSACHSEPYPESKQRSSEESQQIVSRSLHWALRSTQYRLRERVRNDSGVLKSPLNFNPSQNKNCSGRL